MGNGSYCRRSSRACDHREYCCGFCSQSVSRHDGATGELSSQPPVINLPPPPGLSDFSSGSSDDVPKAPEQEPGKDPKPEAGTGLTIQPDTHFELPVIRIGPFSIPWPNNPRTPQKGGSLFPKPNDRAELPRAEVVPKGSRKYRRLPAEPSKPQLPPGSDSTSAEDSGENQEPRPNTDSAPTKE